MAIRVFRRLRELVDVSSAAPSDGQAPVWDAGQQRFGWGTVIDAVPYVAAAPPPSPSDGELWWDVDGVAPAAGGVSGLTTAQIEFQAYTPLFDDFRYRGTVIADWYSVRMYAAPVFTAGAGGWIAILSEYALRVSEVDTTSPALPLGFSAFATVYCSNLSGTQRLILYSDVLLLDSNVAADSGDVLGADFVVQSATGSDLSWDSSLRRVTTTAGGTFNVSVRIGWGPWD